MGDSLRQLVILGNSGHTTSVADAATASGFTVIGFIGMPGDGSPDAKQMSLGSLSDVYLASTEIAWGIGTNFLRARVAEEVSEAYPGARFAPIIHSTAWVSPSATVAPGAVVLAHASVGPGATVGAGAILNTGSSLDHDSRLGDFSSLGPGARTGGDVSIGERSMIGLQAAILQGKTVGFDSVIGAMSLVTRDIADLSVAWGVPARSVRGRHREDPYF